MLDCLVAQMLSTGGQKDVKLMTKINDKKVGARFSISAIRYRTRCYFNVRSKADMSQLNLPHGNDH